MAAGQLSFADARRRGPTIAVLADAARAQERLLELARTRGFVAGSVALSLAELERMLVREARRAGRCPAAAPPLGVELAAWEAARAHTPRSSPFFAVRDDPGHAAALSGLLGTLAHGLLEPADLLRLELSDPTRERVASIAGVLGAARARLDAAAVFEPARALRLAVEALESGLDLPPEIAGAGELELDTILDWTPLRVRLATALARRVRVRIRLPYCAGREELTGPLDPVLRSFERFGDGPAPELELYEPESGSLAPFLRKLFSAAASEPGAAAVRLVSCTSPAAQAREVARSCADLLAAGAAPESIAVVARSLGAGVAEELQAAFDRARIPWHEKRERPAVGAPSVQLALLVLDAAEQDLPREMLEEVLSSRLVAFRSTSAARVLAQAYVRDDATGGGVAARLDAHAARLRRKAASDDADQVIDGRAARALAGVERAREPILRVVQGIRSLPGNGTLRSHATALLDLLRGWGLHERARSLPRDGDSTLDRAIRLAQARDQAALRALEDTCAALVRAADALGLATSPLTRAEWTRLLACTLADDALPRGGARGGAVQLLELREMPGRSFAHVLVVGLVDGELPARPAADPLLSEEDRLAINRAAGRPVFRVVAAAEPSAFAPRSEEPLLFHLALCSAQQSAAVFFSRADAAGRETVRSPFADEVARALGAAAEGERVPLASVPAVETCRTPGELLSRAALDAFADPAWRVTATGEARRARALAGSLLASPLGARFRRVARAAMAERERLRVYTREIDPGPFSGQLPAAALEAVRPLFTFDAAAPLSATSLEDYATCAFRGFARRVLAVRGEEPPEDELDARGRGALLHRCLDAFFRAWMAQGRTTLAADAADLELLRRTAEMEMDAWAAREHVGHPALWRLQRAQIHELLSRVIAREAGVRPLQSEAGFGAPGPTGALRIPAADGTGDIHVRGAIDRVDDAGAGARMVVDYKSSGMSRLRPRLKDLLAPEFQLALYAAAARQDAPESAVDAVYVSLKDARRTDTLRGSAERLGVDPDALLDLDPRRRLALRQIAPRPPNLGDAVEDAVRAMRAGSFPVRPLSCDYCDLNPVCRVPALPVEPDEEASSG